MTNINKPYQVIIAAMVCASIGAAGYLASLVLPAGQPVLSVLAIITMGLVPLVIILILRIPFLLVLGFVIFSFFRIHEVFPFLYPLRIPQLLALATLVSLAWNLFRGSIQPYWSRELTVFGLFFILVTVGVLLATNRADALSSWSGTYVKIAIMTLAIAWLAANKEAFRTSARMIVWAGIVVGLVALSNKISGIGLVEGSRVTIGRDIGSMLGDPNDLSLVLLFPASFSLALLLTERTGVPTKILAGIAFLIVVSAVIATQSRGGLLGVASVCAVFGYRRIRSKALLLAIGSIVLIGLFIVAGVNDRASGGAHEEGIDESAMGRIHAWKAAFNMALDNPFSGVGLNNFLANYFDYSDFWDGQNHAVHSTWFGVLAETGILGFLVFILMVSLVVRISLRSQWRLDPARIGFSHTDAYVMAQATVAGLVGFMVSGTFLTMGFTWPFYVLMALAIAVNRYANQNASSFSIPSTKYQN